MTQINLNHEFSDQSIDKAKVKSLNNDGNPDCIYLLISTKYIEIEVSLTTSDVIAMANGLNMEVKK